jgi:hypothetical protein
VKNKSWFVFFFIVILIASAYIYIQKPHRDITNETVEFSISSDALLKEFLVNEANASAKFLDNTIVVYGTLSENNNNFLVLDNKIYCNFEIEPPEISLNSTLTVKGRCIGFDVLLEQVKLDQCSILYQ